MRATVRTIVWLAAGAVLLSLASPSGARAQEHAAQPPPASTEPSAPPPAQTAAQGGQSAAQSSSTAGAPKQDSLAEAARKTREQKKESKPAKVFTNDNIPTQGGISTVGAEGTSTSSDATSDTSATNAKGAAGSGTDEKAWRGKFATLRHKLEQDQTDLEVMQRELGVLNVQYYDDPVKGMQQGLTREDINKKTADIETKKQAIQADQQAIDDAEEDLRKSGGDPGWSR